MSKNKSIKKISSTAKWLIGIGSVAVILIIIGIIKKTSSNSYSSDSTTRQAALSCTTDMATQMHIHPTLEIFINGRSQTIPANIGIGQFCFNALHTHDSSGVIHVESPIQMDFKLSDFFAVWKETFNKNQILDYKADAAHTIRETVNGIETKDYENTILHDEDQIKIYYEEINP